MILLPFAGWLWLLGLLLASLAGADVRRHHFEAAGLTLGLGLVVVLMQHARAQIARPPVVRRWTWPVVAIPAAVAIAAFGWSITLGPLSDDFALHRLAMSGDVVPAGWEYVRPLPLAVWSAVLAVGGQWGALHLLSVCVHAINAVMVARIGSLLSRRSIGLTAGVIVAAFPASAEAVAWGAGIFDVSATVCTLAAILLWLTMPSSSARTTLLCVVLILGLLCKESAIAIPGLVLAFAMTRFGRTPGLRKNATALACLLATAAVFLILRGSASSSVRDQMMRLPRDNRAVKDLVVRPFAALAIPARTDRGVGAAAYCLGGSALLIVGLLLLQLRSRRAALDEAPDTGERSAIALLGVAWIGITALPLLTEFGVGPDLEGGRFVYAPSVGFALLIASATPSGGRAVRAAFAAALALLLASYGAGVLEQRRVWREAAGTRDAVLRQAATSAAAARCGAVRVLDPPDNVRGAYVFRVGIEDALSAIATTKGGPDCTFQWSNGVLVSVDDSAKPGA
jgi:hypothetical protein